MKVTGVVMGGADRTPRARQPRMLPDVVAPRGDVSQTVVVSGAQQLRDAQAAEHQQMPDRRVAKRKSSCQEGGERSVCRGPKPREPRVWVRSTAFSAALRGPSKSGQPTLARVIF